MLAFQIPVSSDTLTPSEEEKKERYSFHIHLRDINIFIPSNLIAGLPITAAILQSTLEVGNISQKRTKHQAI
jgi:hypothetical protein